MQQVTANVYVETGTFGCNPSFVTTTEGIVMIDTPYLPGNAVKWRDEIAKRGEVRYIINTEHHADHISGNYFFSGTVVSYQGTKEMFESPISKALPAPRETIEEMGLDGSSGIQNFILSRYKDLDPEGLPLAENYKLNPPVITFSERLSLYVGDHTFELTHLPGHTSNEVGVYIPQERVFFTGDNFVHQYQPAMTQCCPLEWIESLEKIEATDADVFVPGHGEVGDKKAVREFREFIAECVDTVRKAMDQGLSAEEATERISFETEAYPPALHPGPEWQRINVRRIYEMLAK